MSDSFQDWINFELLSQNFESQDRFISFIYRIDKSELKKVTKDILRDYEIKN